jgi:hypothetical protein
MLEDGSPNLPGPGIRGSRTRETMLVCLTEHNPSCIPWPSFCRHARSRPNAGEPAMTSEPPLSHEIRYVLSVYGGILIARMAMLLRNVALMAKLRLVSARLCDRASAARSRRRFPAMVTEPEREFPAYSPERTTRPRRFLQNVDQDCDRRSTANLRLGLERRLVPGI